MKQILNSSMLLVFLVACGSSDTNTTCDDPADPNCMNETCDKVKDENGACVDECLYGTLGDGSCIPDPTPGSCARQPTGSSFVSSAIAIDDNGDDDFPNAGPQCVDPANQWRGPGLRAGDFLTVNNAWNGEQSSAQWSQCAELVQSQGAYWPTWTYDWGNEDDLIEGLEEWTVKSYPEMIYGAKSERKVSGSCEDIGLPAPYKELPQFSISLDYETRDGNSYVGDIRVTQDDGTRVDQPVTNGDRNIAIESFFHSDCNIQRSGDDSNTEYEIMVWLEKGNERRPSGDPVVGTFTDSQGHVFDIYTKPRGNDSYVAYVAQTPIYQGVIPWNEFIEDLRANSANYGDDEGNMIRPFNDQWCMANILFGSEIWWGDGAVQVNDYQIKRDY